MASVQIAQETVDITLVFGGGVVVGLLKLGIADEDFAMFTPIFWLLEKSAFAQTRRIMAIAYR